MIWFLDEVPSNGRVGGKARNLATMMEAGVRVPRGLVISAGAFEGDALGPGARDRVHRLIADLRAPWAVRSSGVGEDAADVSFAGEFDTILDVTDPEALEKAIHSVRASRRGERAQSYAEARGLEVVMEMAVVVQETVPADYAGVLFTADPIDGARDRMVGSFVRGLGDRLVSGEETGEAFELFWPRGSYDGPDALRRHGRRMFRVGRRLARLLGGPQDIEWAIRGRKLWILQSRPISTLRAYDPDTGIWNHTRTGNYLWSNANVGEAQPGVMTPLTWDVVQISAGAAFRNPMPGEHPLLGNIAGRLYVNLSHLASVMGSLGFDRSQTERQTMAFLGTVPEEVEVPIVPHARFEVLRHVIPRTVSTWFGARKDLRALEGFVEGMPARVAALEVMIGETQEPEELAPLWHERVEPLMRRTCEVLGAVSSWCENRYRPVRSELAEKVGVEDADLLFSGIGDESGELSSLEPLMGLREVAKGRLGRREYLQKYGHRCVHEYELSEPRPREDPSWIDRQLEVLREMDPEVLLQRRRADTKAAWERFTERYPDEAASMRERVTVAGTAAKWREAVRSECARVLGTGRVFALRAGELTGLVDDVFFVSLSELLDTLRGRQVPDNEVERRRGSYARLCELPSYPAFIRGRFDPFEWAERDDRRVDLFDATAQTAPEHPDGAIVSGLAASGGVAEGPVRHLRRPEDARHLEPGEILVAVATNVGWTPVFPRAAAIVTDVGAPLSHAAIIARELGIPAVVGTRNATRVLKDGDMVRVDGGRGTVERLAKGS